MKRSYYSCSNILGVALLAGLWTIACSSDDSSNPIGTGGSTASTGGKSSTGTGTAKTGGASSTGTAKTGGSPGVGGTAATTAAGGTPSTSTTSTKATGGTTSTSTSGVGGVTGGGTTGVGGGGGVGTGGVVATGGSTGDAGPDASTFTCTGCLKLYVPLAAAKAQTDFEVDYGTSTTIDLSSGSITARVYVDTQSTGGLRVYAKNDDVTGYASVYSTWMNLTDLDGKWTDVKLDLSTVAAGPTPPVSGTFDKGIIRWVGINVNAGDAPDGSVIEPVTVYVDSVKFTPANVTEDFLFNTSVEGFAINTYNSPAAGSTIAWTNSQ